MIRLGVMGYGHRISSVIKHCLRPVEPGIRVSASERVRHVDPFGREVISRSTDGGHTWGEPRAIRAILSYDDAATWDAANVLALREFPYSADMGYPVALEVNPAEVLCAYYSVPGPDMPGYESHDPNEARILSTRIWLG